MSETIEKHTGTGSIAIAFLVYVVLSILLLSGTNIASNLGQLFGFLLFPIAITKFLTRKKSEDTKNKAMLVIGVCANLLVLGIVYSEWKSQSDLSKTIDQYAIVDGKMAGNIEGTTDELNKFPNKATLPGYTPSGYDTLDGLMKYNFAVIQPYMQRYEKNALAMENVDLVSVLTPKLFFDKADIKRAQGMLDNLKALVKEQDVIMYEMFAAQKKAFENVNVDEKLKKEFYAGIAKGNKDAEASLALQHNASNNSISGFQTILNLATKNFGKTKIENGGIDFGNDVDNQAYNIAINKIQTAAAEEERIIKLREKQQKEKIEKLKKQIGN